MFSAGIFIVYIVTFAYSLPILATDTERLNTLLDRYKIMWVIGVVAVLCLLVVIPFEVGSIARGETSPVPWIAFGRQAPRHGYFQGILAFLSTSIFVLWAFLIPGHIYANHIKTKKRERPTCPYVVNVLIGIIISIEYNPIYRLLE